MGLDALRKIVVELQDASVASGPVSPDLAERLLARFGLSRAPQGKLAVPKDDAILELCTASARGILDAAQAHASARESAKVGVEHLALALLDDPECRGTRAVATLGGDLGRARGAAEGLTPEEKGDPEAGLHFSPTGRIAIVSAYAASAGMGNPFVGTEHLALAVFGGGFGETVDPGAFAPTRVRDAVARAQAEE